MINLNFKYLHYEIIIWFPWFVFGRYNSLLTLCILIIYLFFAEERQHLKFYLYEYDTFSSQCVSLAKCHFYTTNASAFFVRHLKRLVSCNHESLPFTYLGVLIFVGAPKVQFFSLWLIRFVIKVFLEKEDRLVWPTKFSY